MTAAPSVNPRKRATHPEHQGGYFLSVWRAVSAKLYVVVRGIGFSTSRCPFFWSRRPFLMYWRFPADLGAIPGVRANLRVELRAPICVRFGVILRARFGRFFRPILISKLSRGTSVSILAIVLFSFLVI